MQHEREVYRVEHSDTGRGPYASYHGGRHHIDYDARRQPGPWWDGLRDFKGTGTDYDSEHLFAFASWEHLTRWFHRHEREGLAHCGYVVRVLLVRTIVGESSRQLIFDARSAYAAATLSLCPEATQEVPIAA